MFKRGCIPLGRYEGPVGKLMSGSATAPRDPSAVSYLPGLGNRVRKSHALLTGAFRSVLDAHWLRDYVSCLAHLRHFERLLDDYLAHDEVLREAYIASPADGDGERLAALRALRTRLRHLVGQAHDIAALHPSDLHPPCRMDFALEFLGMSKTLRECLEQQEAQLLPLYKARSADDESARSGDASEIAGAGDPPAVAGWPRSA